MHGRVTATDQLTPGMVRVTLGGGDLEHLSMPEATDAYVNAAFRPEGATYDAVFDPQTVRDTHPPEQQPARRRYTVRAWDPDAHLLTIDFVVHGDEGVAGPWAATAAPGDALVFSGPSGGYRPDPTADWHLLVGDESALPAIAASLEALPAGRDGGRAGRLRRPRARDRAARVRRTSTSPGCTAAGARRTPRSWPTRSVR